MAFRGTFTVTITPFDAAGELDLGALASFVEWQIREGIHGLIPLGSTGEFLSLSNDETTAVIETVVRAAAGRVPVIIGSGAEDTGEVVRRSREAERLGADGVMIIPPFYSTPTEDELYHHYKTAADAIGIPVMIYNNPAVTNVGLTPPIVAHLAAIEGCRYIKASTLEVTRVRDIIRLCGDRLTVFGGVLGFESFVAGAQGWVSVASTSRRHPWLGYSSWWPIKAGSWRAAISITVGCRSSGGFRTVLRWRDQVVADPYGIPGRRAPPATVAPAGRAAECHGGIGAGFRPALSEVVSVSPTAVGSGRRDQSDPRVDARS